MCAGCKRGFRPAIGPHPLSSNSADMNADGSGALGGLLSDRTAGYISIGGKQ